MKVRHHGYNVYVAALETNTNANIDSVCAQYLPLPSFEEVTSALNFETADCHVLGACDLYTTKAAGSDKKLYRTIESSLQTHHESLLRLSASLSPPQAETLADELNLSRSSPFGPLSQISSRRTYAYLIATLNASHPDYDFSHLLRPADFRRERSYRTAMNSIDSTLHNLRPRSSPLSPPPIPQKPGGSSGSSSSGSAGTGSSVWGPAMWRLMDAEMDLKHCAVYSYAPEEEAFVGCDYGDEGGGAIWSLNYFFFNKERKRVAYLYLRGLSVLSHSPVIGPVTPQAGSRHKRTMSARGSVDYDAAATPVAAGYADGASKRARYWLGDQVDSYHVQRVGSWNRNGDVIRDPGDDEVDADEDEGQYWIGIGDMSDDDEDFPREREKSAVRAMSEHLMETMEV